MTSHGQWVKEWMNIDDYVYESTLGICYFFCLLHLLSLGTGLPEQVLKYLTHTSQSENFILLDQSFAVGVRTWLK